MTDTRTSRSFDADHLGIALILVSAIGFGTLGIFGLYAQRAALSIPTVLAVRFLLASVLVWGYLFWRGNATVLRGRHLGFALVLGGVGYTAQSGLYFLGLEYMTAGLVAIVLYTYPAFVVLLAVATIGERLSRSVLLALCLSFAGIVLITGATPEGASIVGVLIVLGGAIAYACYITGSRAVLDAVDPMVLTAYVLPSAGVAYVGIGTATGQLAVPSTPQAWTILFCIAVFATAVPVVTFFAGLQYIGASRASIVSTAEPTVTVVLGAALFAEPVTATTVIGGAAILTGVIVLERE